MDFSIDPHGISDVVAYTLAGAGLVLALHLITKGEKATARRVAISSARKRLEDARKMPIF